MTKSEEYISKIRSLTIEGLHSLWESIKNKNTPGWPNGIAFEYFLLRAYELEGAEVRWPYVVTKYGEKVEQVDGAIHFPDNTISVLVEAKNQQEPMNVEPIAKMRNKLQRRPSAVIGAVFSVSGFTDPALILCDYMAPQTILLWEKKQVEYCFYNKCFLRGTLVKYRNAVEEGFNSNFDITEL